MATFVFLLQGVSPTTQDLTDILQFAGVGGFDSKIQVGAYNDTTHIKTALDADKSSGNTPNNVKYIASGTADWGDGTEALNLILDAECTQKITFSDGASVITEDNTFYAYDGTTPATGPTGVTFQAAESGDAAWTAADGSGSALTVADSLTPATDHDFYIAMSASPDSVGLKEDFSIRMELTYS